ncbi:MAG: hypothetical protein OK449_09020 [Thaumarchaeota archaeon]|nr:hypothetical protein [Nitrososphaerota archaeon]
MHKSRGVSEVVSSVSMLAITIAVLGGVGLISLGSLRSANGVLLAGSESAASEAGVLLTVVATQSNSSGTFVWLFNYGWNQAHLTSVYLDGGLAQGWTSSCSLLSPKDMCVVQLPPGTHGTVSVTFGARTITLSV